VQPEETGSDQIFIIPHPAVRSANQERETLPFASDEQGTLPIARHRKRWRRPSSRAERAIPFTATGPSRRLRNRATPRTAGCSSCATRRNSGLHWPKLWASPSGHGSGVFDVRSASEKSGASHPGAGRRSHDCDDSGMDLAVGREKCRSLRSTTCSRHSRTRLLPSSNWCLISSIPSTARFAELPRRFALRTARAPDAGGAPIRRTHRRCPRNYIVSQQIQVRGGCSVPGRLGNS
jgi:hypothetical protein